MNQRLQILKTIDNNGRILAFLYKTTTNSGQLCKIDANKTRAIPDPRFVTGNKDIWITLEPFGRASQSRHANINVIEIMCSKFHLDDVKTVGDVEDTNFHQETVC